MNEKAYLFKDTKEYEDIKKIQKLRFCIISNFKSQFCRNNLMLFTLDNV